MGFSSCHGRPKSSGEIDSFFRKLARRVKTLNPCQQENVMNRFEEVVESTERGTHCNRIYSSALVRSKSKVSKDEKIRDTKRKRSRCRRLSCCRKKKSVCRCEDESKREKQSKQEKANKREKSCRPCTTCSRWNADDIQRDRSSRHRSCSLFSCHCSCRYPDKLQKSPSKTREESFCRCISKKEDKKKP